MKDCSPDVWLRKERNRHRKAREEMRKKRERERKIQRLKRQKNHRGDENGSEN